MLPGVKEIGLDGRAAAVVPPLIKALRNDDALMREIAIESLGSLGPDSAGKAVPELIRRFGSDPSQRLRLHAAWALPRLDPEGTAAIPALVAGLNDRNWQMRLSAVSTVGQFGPRARSAVPGLIASLSDSEAYVRSAAAAVLAKIGPASRTVPPLIEAYQRELKHGDWTVSYMIAIALGQIGSEAAPAVPRARGGTQDRHTQRPELRCPGPREDRPGAGPALPALLNALHDPDWSVRQAAAESISLVGADPEIVIPPLIAVLKDDMDYVRAAAAVSLGRLGPAARAAIPRLIELQNEEASRTREEAKKALEQIGDQPREDRAGPDQKSFPLADRRPPRSLEVSEACRRQSVCVT